MNMNQEYESERLLGTFSFFCMHHGVSAAEGTVPVASSVERYWLVLHLIRCGRMCGAPSEQRFILMCPSGG